MFRHHRREARWTGFLVAIALGLAGCGDGPSVDEAIGADDSSTTVPAPDTTEPAPTTTVATTTTAAATTTTAAVPTTGVPASTTTAAVPTTPAPAPAPTPPSGFVVVDQRTAGGFSLAIPGDYLAIDVAGDLVAQADAAALDAAGRAALDAFAVSRGQGDFRLAAFRFNTGSDHTDNVLVVRYGDAAGEVGTVQLEEIYRRGFVDPGGSVFASEVTTVAGRPAVVMEGERVVGGQILSRQWVGLVVGDGAIWEIVVTLGLPVDELDGVAALQVIDSFSLVG